MKKNENIGKWTLFMLFTQIFLLILFTPANSYSISKSLSSNSQIIIEDKNRNKTLDNLIGVGSSLLSLFLINGIGFVSAESDEDEKLWCCYEMKEEHEGAECQLLEVGDPEDLCSEENTKSMPCEETGECKLGTCIDDSEGTCSISSKRLCENNDGEWKDKDISSVETCQSGCCEIGGVKTYETEGACKILAEKQGQDNYDNFDTDVSEEDCRVLSEERGACLLGYGECRITTEKDCVKNLDRDYSDFYKGLLCTHPDLDTICEPTEKTTCYSDGKIYFIDSCDNRANIYDSDKINDDPYWKKIFFKNEVCKIDLNTDSSIKECGNCISEESTCVSNNEEDLDATKGDYICKDLRCVDEEGDTRMNGEQWCIYESYVGDSRDVVGSLHWIASCSNGGVRYEMGDRWRGMVCGESIITENNRNISSAIVRGNEGHLCLAANEDIEGYKYYEDGDDKGEPKDHDKTFEHNNKTCLETSSDCRLQEVRVGGGPSDNEYFKFDICVPKYPKGFDLAPNFLFEEDADYEEAQEEAKDVCNMASQECTYIEQKKLLADWEFGKWKCIVNCECKESEFTEEMNDLCISLGDCGGYVNIEGNYTSYGFYSEAKPSLFLFTQYSKFANESKIGKGDLPELIDGTYLERWIGEELAEIDLGDDDPRKWVRTTITVSGISGGSIGGILTGLAIANSWNPGGWALAIIVSLIGAISGILKAFGIGDTRERTIEFECNPWEPPAENYNCSSCNDHPYLPCNEYRCESLGAGCRINNTGIYEEENPQCTHLDPSDTTPPQIKFVDVINQIKGGVEIEGTTIDDGIEKGVEITSPEGPEESIEINTPISINLKTKNPENEELEFSKCRHTFDKNEVSEVITPSVVEDWSSSHFLQGTKLSKYKNISLSLPNLDSDYVESIGETMDGIRIGELNMYIACSDLVGNWNTKPYTIKFKILESDNTPPIIMSFTPKNESYLPYGKNETNLIIELNEPSECRWDNEKGQDFEDMTEFNLCESYDSEKVKSGWGCFTELKNLNEGQNNIWIKCKDHPQVCNKEEDSCDYEGDLTEEDRNTNKQDTLYTLYKTQVPLKISSLSVTRKETKDVGESTIYLDIESYNSKTIRSGDSPIEIGINVETEGGTYDGDSICRYKFDPSRGGGGDFFYSTGETEHVQPSLFRLEGEENVTITCEDKTGNIAKEHGIFKIEIDDIPPEITRVYRNGGDLIIKTDKMSKCYFHPSTCNFNFEDEDVEEMSVVFSKIHKADWEDKKNYNIRCEDIWGNNEKGCAIRVSSLE